MIHLWDFQRSAVNNALKALEEHRRVLVVSPGGSGKTVMIAEAARRFLAQGKRVLVLAHRRELVTQAHAHFERHGIPAKDIAVVIPGSESANERARLRVGTINTLFARETYYPVDVVLVDEAHHVRATMYETVAARYKRAQWIGFTATPFRLDRRGLGDAFDAMIVAASPSELIAEGRILQPRYYRAPEDATPDLTNLARANGDYNLKQLTERVTRGALVGGVVDHWEKLAEGRSTIGFAVGKRHADLLAREFLSRGHRAACLLDDASPAEREDLLGRTASGKLDILFSCMILTEGYDLPDCEAVILARPTLSMALFLQQSYRAMRAGSRRKRRPLILDHGRNYGRFGLPDADREYSLTTGNVERSQAALVRECPACGMVSPIATAVCPGCGLPLTDQREIPGETAEELVLVTKANLEATKVHIRAKLASLGTPPEKIEYFVRCFTAGV